MYLKTYKISLNVQNACEIIVEWFKALLFSENSRCMENDQ